MRYMKSIRVFLKALTLSLIDVFQKGYMYHSGALTYHFMLAIAPLTIVLLNMLSFFPLVDVGEIEKFLSGVLPQYTSRIVKEILEVQKRSGETSFVALMLSYFFSVGFIKYMGRAFAFVSEGKLGERRELFYWVFMPVFLLAVVVSLSVYFFISIYIKLVLPLGVLPLLYVFYLIPGTLILTLLYRSFAKEPPSMKEVFSVSLLVSFLLSLAQLGFTWYIANVFRGSLLYGSLSAIVVFLLWSNTLFLMLLFGARLIYRLKTL